jgi:ferredoxin
MVRGIVDEQRCQEHGRCEIIAAHLFAVDDRGISSVLVGDIDPADLADAEEAGQSCPERAITLE